MPRKQEENQQLIDKRKENILRASLNLFSLYGYYAINMDDIANKAKCSRALVYHYFGNKEEIFYQLMQKISNFMRKITNSVDYSKTAKECMYEIIDRLLFEMYEGPQKKDMPSILYLVLNLPLQREYLPKPKVKFDLHNCPIGERNIYEVTYYLIKKGQEENDFLEGDVKEYTIALLSLIKGVAYNKIFIKKPYCVIHASTIMNLLLKRSE